MKQLSRLCLSSILALAVGLAFTAVAVAQSDITAPGDAIVLVNGVNDGDGDAGPPPAGEVVSHAIDNVTQKYLNFLDLGSGFSVTPGVGSTFVTGLRLFTANDVEARDPASYRLEGSNNGLDFSLISEGALALPAGRNLGSLVTPIDPLTQFNQEVSFSNTSAYSSYRVTFPTLKDAAAANSMQIAEVELLGTVVPEPGTWALLGGCAVGWLRVRTKIRRRVS